MKYILHLFVTRYRALTRVTVILIEITAIYEEALEADDLCDISQDL